jgi:hypothetical protein
MTRFHSRQTGFDYNFNAIQDESNELFSAYKDMFEMAISQSSTTRTMLAIHLPWINKLLVDPFPSSL